MSSQPPDTPAPAAEVKAEESVEAGGDVTMTGMEQPAAPVSKYVSGTTLTKKDFDIMTGILKRISEHEDENGYQVAFEFLRVVSKRLLPEYHQIIKEVIAISTIKGKIAKKSYRSFKEFIRDFTLISHNAQVFNRRSAPVYADSIKLSEMFKDELKKLVEEKYLTEKDAELPDLGEIPDVEDSPPPEPAEEEDAEVEEDEEEEDEDEEEDDTDDERPRRKGKKAGRRSSALVKREGKVDDIGKDDPKEQKKRGRPPKVHTPMEARINTLLKSMRKFKHPGGELMILPFEKLPDKTAMPDYYQEIKNPIAMDLIKRKAKRKKYISVDQALKDLELMFDNAKSYNLESSQVYKDATHLQKQARDIAEQEKKKPDTDFVDEDGRLPLPEILHNGEIWKVGDWVHIVNENDISKPIVAQIYRTWQDPEGQKWINACWYYRPEQTVHHHEKHFFENEVVKTGRYMDHKIDEVIDHCFVMFFTRYNKGRPRGFPADKEVYVCEARYNEDKHKLNKIKTWASCVPDEVREKDYEMDLFDVPRKIKKVPSPIKHLLRDNATEDDPLPKATMLSQNAPPLLGAVHKRPREANESPPPEPTPSPPPTPEPVRPPITNERARYDSQGDISMSGTPSVAPLPSPRTNTVNMQSQYGQQFAPVRPSASPAPLSQPVSYHSHSTPTVAPAQPALYQPQTSYNQYTPAITPVIQHSNPLANYSNYQSLAAPPPRPVAPVSTPHSSSHSNAYIPPRPIEVYTLAEAANSSIPADIRAQFHHDEYGRVLFYTAPPLDANPVPEDSQVLGHSLRYLADKARSRADDEKKRKAREIELEATAADRLKQFKTGEDGQKNWLVNERLKSVKKWSEAMEKGTDELYQQLHGENWKEVREQDLARLAVQQEKAFNDQKDNEKFKKARADAKEVAIKGFRWL